MPDPKTGAGSTSTPNSTAELESDDKQAEVAKLVSALLSSEEFKKGIADMQNSMYNSRSKHDIAALKKDITGEFKSALEEGVKPLTDRFSEFSEKLQGKDKQLSAKEQEEQESQKQIKALQEQVEKVNQEREAERKASARAKKENLIQEAYLGADGDPKAWTLAKGHLLDLVQGEVGDGERPPTLYMDLEDSSGNKGQYQLKDAVKLWLETDTGSYCRKKTNAGGSGVLAGEGVGEPPMDISKDSSPQAEFAKSFYGSPVPSGG